VDFKEHQISEIDENIQDSLTIKNIDPATEDDTTIKYLSKIVKD